jgi:O-antigen/teichoic acid export membrane protein
MFKRIGLSFAAQLVSLLVSLADRMLIVGVLVRAWGTELYADWSLLLASAGILTLAELGLNIYFGNCWQRAYAGGRPGEFQRLLSIALACYMVLAGVLALIALAAVTGSDPTTALSLRRLDSAEAQAVSLVLAAFIISRIARGVMLQLYRGRGDFARGIIIDSLAQAITVLLVATAALNGAGVLHVALLYLTTDLAAGWLVMLIDIRRRYPDLRFVPALPARAEMTALRKELRWLAIIQGAPSAWLHVPVIALGFLTAAGSQIVAFVLLRTLVNFARQLVSMLSIAAGVELATLIHAGDRESAARQLKHLSLLSCVMTISVAVGLYIFGSPVLRLWTGRGELFDPWLLSWLLVAAVVSAPSMPLAAITMLGGNPRSGAIAALVQLGLGLSASVVAGHAFGVTGVAAGLAIGEIVALAIVLPMLAARPVVGVDWAAHLTRCIPPTLISGAWCAVVGFVVTSVVETGTLLMLLLSAGVWASIGAAPCLLLALDVEQRQALLRTMSRKGRLAP